MKRRHTTPSYYARNAAIHLCYNAPIIQSIPQPTITLAEELLWNWIKNVFRSAGISRWC